MPSSSSAPSQPRENIRKTLVPNDPDFREQSRNGRLIPTFAFIDPFGWTGVPFTVMRQILPERSCEVFVNFMYEEINRFISHPDQVSNFDTFFGTDAWKRCASEKDPRKRNRCLHDLYMNQLQSVAGATFVRSFEMSNAKDVTDYFLFYGTKEILGLKKMKEAMWRADESGEFRFSDATNPNQLVIFEKAPNLGQLQASLVSKFRGVEVAVADIEKFVLIETAFRETHYKSILKALEQDSRLSVVAPKAGRRAGTFRDPQMIVRFAS